MKKIFIITLIALTTSLCYSQQNVPAAQDSSGKKGSHQIKTVPAKVIRVDKASETNRKPFPPLKTRQDTLRYLIEQHHQQKAGKP
jgi:hypothetical protein